MRHISRFAVIPFGKCKECHHCAASRHSVKPVQGPPGGLDIVPERAGGEFSTGTGRSASCKPVVQPDDENGETRRIEQLQQDPTVIINGGDKEDEPVERGCERDDILPRPVPCKVREQAGCKKTAGSSVLDIKPGAGFPQGNAKEGTPESQDWNKRSEGNCRGYRVIRVFCHGYRTPVYMEDNREYSVCIIPTAWYISG